MKNIRQFEIVTEIYRQGSISRAAESLGIAQPTLSKLLHRLEEELNTELFDRTVNPIRLTTAGKSYVDAAQKILDIEHQLEKRLDKLNNNASNDIRIGISPSRAPYIMPNLLSDYRKQCPDGKVTVRELNTVQLNAALQRGDLDIMISLLNDSTRSFRCVPLFEETTLLAVPFSMQHLSAEEILRTQPFISIGSGLKMWKSLKIIMDSLNRPAPEIECTSIESALALVKNGFGAMLVPSYLADHNDTHTDKVKFLFLPEQYYRDFANELERKVCLFYRNDAFLSDAEEKFIAVCKNTAGK